MIQEVKLRADNPKAGYAPPDPIGMVLRDVPGVVSQAIRMGFQGASTLRGRKPKWLRALSDVRLVSVRGDREPAIRFDAPQFGDVAGDLYAQLELWPSSRPDPEDTGFDLVGDIVRDIADRNSDSGRFDYPLLRRVTALGRVLNGCFDRMAITGRRYEEPHAALVDKTVIATAHEFCSDTPAPARARMVGVLDMLQASTQSFTLELDEGARAHGVLAEGDIDALADLFHRRVLVLGQAVFRASGRFLRIDADSVTLAVDEPPIWSLVPEPSDARLDARSLGAPRGRRRGLAAIVGQWPGDETDEAIAELLRELS